MGHFSKLTLFSLLLFTQSCFNVGQGKVIISTENTSPSVLSFGYDAVIDKTITWNDVFKQKENNYFVYFYSETCYYCQQIKNDIISFALNDKIATYFVHFQKEMPLGKNIEETIGVSNVNDLFIMGTPSLVGISNSVVTINVAGVKEIKEIISIY